MEPEVVGAIWGGLTGSTVTGGFALISQLLQKRQAHEADSRKRSEAAAVECRRVLHQIADVPEKDHEYGFDGSTLSGLADEFIGELAGHLYREVELISDAPTREDLLAVQRAILDHYPISKTLGVSQVAVLYALTAYGLDVVASYLRGDASPSRSSEIVRILQTS
ncbi:hypothetical protein [Micromonospora sediminicola]|uniref:hypothetical protein n=1 Tax=Micromonospora sediminicola TaxID=946078 RepID=UPI003411DD86